MASSHNGLVALVQARQGDATLVSLLATAAGRVTAEAQAQASALRHEAIRLRHDAWRDLQSAKSDFEASRQRTMVIRDLGLDDELKAAAAHAASEDLVRSRKSLRRAAETIEEAVSAARLAESQAEMVVRRAAACPEVLAFEVLRNPSGHFNKREGGNDRTLASVGRSSPRQPQATAPHPALSGPQAPGPICTDDAAAA